MLLDFPEVKKNPAENPIKKEPEVMPKKIPALVMSSPDLEVKTAGISSVGSSVMFIFISSVDDSSVSSVFISVEFSIVVLSKIIFEAE